MTIEDVREELISILTEIEITGGSMVTSAYKDELKVAIETMRKYQKIEQIVKEWEFDHESMFDSMEKISGVMEDGQTND